jgi:hypothetical protein
VLKAEICANLVDDDCDGVVDNIRRRRRRLDRLQAATATTATLW